MTDTSKLRKVFPWMMGFVGVFWVWTVVLMIAWPWQKLTQWQPEMKLLAICANKEACSIDFADLDKARTEGKIIGLMPTDAVGEVHDKDAWLSWKKASDKPWQIEVKRSSWHFEYAVRYSIENDKPVLKEARLVDSDMLGLAFPLAFFTLLGLFLRSFRKQ